MAISKIPRAWAGEFRKLKQDLDALAARVNEVKAQHNALLAKLDADGGVADTNYAAAVPVAGADVVVQTK